MSATDQTAVSQTAPFIASDQWMDLADEKPFELPPGNTEEAIALLRLWREDKNDEQEQRETWDYLRRVLDEDRFSDRKLFS